MLRRELQGRTVHSHLEAPQNPELERPLELRSGKRACNRRAVGCLVTSRRHRRTCQQNEELAGLRGTQIIMPGSNRGLECRADVSALDEREARQPGTAQRSEVGFQLVERLGDEAGTLCSRASPSNGSKEILTKVTRWEPSKRSAVWTVRKTQLG